MWVYDTRCGFCGLSRLLQTYSPFLSSKVSGYFHKFLNFCLSVIRTLSISYPFRFGLVFFSMHTSRRIVFRTIVPTSPCIGQQSHLRLFLIPHSQGRSNGYLHASANTIKNVTLDVHQQKITARISEKVRVVDTEKENYYIRGNEAKFSDSSSILLVQRISLLVALDDYVAFCWQPGRIPII